MENATVVSGKPMEDARCGTERMVTHDALLVVIGIYIYSGNRIFDFKCKRTVTGMRSEWNKCNFCRWQSDWGCEAICENHNEYEPVIDRLIEKAHEKSLSVQDVITLINYTEGQ